jgi:DNA-binding SARP family transcriptional activator
VRYEILRPIRVVDDGKYYSLSARKAEVLLATLLIKFDQVVSIDLLVDELWPTKPPRRATAALHVYVSHVRKFLNRGNRGSSPIVTRSPGYLLHLDGEDETDLLEFESLMDRARAQIRANEYEKSVHLLKTALDLWVGQPLSELREGPLISVFAAWLEELRLECIEMYVRSNFELARYHEMVPFLHSLVVQYPVHEVFYQQLMVALRGAGRRAEALKVYESARNILRSELKVEPCRGLQELFTELLADESQVHLPRPRPRPPASSEAVAIQPGRRHS